jgi:hypothetical protein
MVDIINMKVNLMEVDKETLKEKEVMEVVVEVIEVNNQMAIQTTTIISRSKSVHEPLGSLFRALIIFL